ncbi:hypothetical protein ACFQY0_05215 [Haloferula chungangensis]|uniref:DUF1405 domain-containing protein n=1 Tax=Haloferula chungangensis TaxID=1048331 RepID=A0ABW2L5Y4_9BACT
MPELVHHATESPREAPWHAGLRAARANVVPGLMVQAVMVSLLIAYFLHPPTRDFLGRMAEVKVRWGYAYSALTAVVAGGLIPELLRIFVFQGGKVERANFSNFLFAASFWAGMGVLVDAFYRLQVSWWGDEATAAVVVPQVLVDQFIFSPFVTAPLTTWLYEWKNRGYRMGPGFFTLGYYRKNIFPTVVAIWGVWIPIVTVLYLLPEPVQMPMYSLALTMWVMLYTWMSEERLRGSDRGSVRNPIESE